MKRGFLIGVFDCCHIGHLRLLDRASNMCDELVVAVVEDEAVRAQKGDGRPMFPFHHRVAIIERLKATAYAVRSKTFNPTEAFLIAEHDFGKIDVFFKGEDQSHIDTSEIEGRGVEIVTLTRTPNVSSTEIIRRLSS